MECTRVKDPGGKAFSNASIGEAGEKAFPARADGKKSSECLCMESISRTYLRDAVQRY